MKTYDLDLEIGANWSYTAGSHYLVIAHYRGKVEQIDGRWHWQSTYYNSHTMLLFTAAFDHGTKDDLPAAKNAAEQAIALHNQRAREGYTSR